MEQLIVIAVFAVCAAACVKILADSYFTAIYTRDTSNAIHAAESGAESYKAVSGDIGKMAEIMGGEVVSIGGEASAIVYYDNDWLLCGEENAVYRLLMVNVKPEDGTSALSIGELSVEKLTGEVIMSLTVSARRG